MIKEEYVSFETAKLLQEKEFCEECDYWYSEYGEQCCCPSVVSMECLCPTQSMTMRWLREVHNIVIVTFPIRTVSSELAYNVSIYNTNAEHKKLMDKDYQTYEQACETAIKYCLINLI